MRNIFTALKKFFLTPLAASASIVFFISYFFDLEIIYISDTQVLYAGLISLCIVCLLCFFEINDRYIFSRQKMLFATNFFTTSLPLVMILFLPIISLIFSYKEDALLVGLIFSLLVIVLYFFSREKSGLKTISNDICSKPSLYVIFLIFLSAIAVRILNNIYYGIGYLDEYLHISKGTDIFSGSVRDFNQLGIYIRGDYVSYIFGLINEVIGSNLAIADTVWTVLLSTLILFVTYKTAQRLNFPNFLIYWLLIIYAILPLAIFNHTYIRMFVVYELLLAFSIFVSIALLQGRKGGKFMFIAGASFTLILFVISQELEILPIIFLYFFALTFFCYGRLGFVKDHIKQNYSYLLLLIILSSFIILKILFPLILNIDITHGSGSTIKTFIYFFGFISLITGVGLVSLFVSLRSEKYLSPQRNSLLFITLSLVIFIILHLLLPGELQAIRGLMYLSPLLVLGFAASLYLLPIRDGVRKIIIVSLISTISLSTINMYVANVPEIKGEINYFNFSDAYDSLRNCKSKKYALIHSNYISEVYGVQFDGLIYTNNENLIRDLGFKNVGDSDFVDIYTGTPVINSTDKLESLLSQGEFCILMMEERRHSRIYVSDHDFNLIKENTLQKAKPNHYGLVVLTNK